GVDGIEEVNSSSLENFSAVVVKVDHDADLDEVAEDIRREIDLINDFPDEAKDPVIEVVEQRVPVISIVVFSDTPEHRLKDAAEEMKDELLDSELISSVYVSGTRLEEIAVEVQPDKLEAYNLTFE